MTALPGGGGGRKHKSPRILGKRGLLENLEFKTRWAPLCVMNNESLPLLGIEHLPSSSYKFYLWSL